MLIRQTAIGLVLALLVALPVGALEFPPDDIERQRLEALRGVAMYQFSLGIIYQNGSGVPQNYVEAVKWYRMAAEQGHAHSQHSLGRMYRYGRGVSKNYVEAVKWYRKAAEQGLAVAQNDLGNRYRLGQGVPQDYAEAAKWYRKAAEQGYAGAQYSLGIHYDKGPGVPQDYAEAAKWYRKAAEQGSAGAQYSLGIRYDKGQGVPQDYSEAMLWYRKAAIQGHTKAHNRLVNMNRKGLVPASKPSPRSPKKWKLGGFGSGFFVTSRGDVLTNYHVVEGCKRVIIGKEHVSIYAKDKTSDLALLKTSIKPKLVPKFRLGRGIRLGEDVVATGFPFRRLLGSGLSVTKGTVSRLKGIGGDRRSIQITAPIQPGSSGGPVLDKSGNIIGVIVSKLDAIKTVKLTGSLPQNINFAINAATARAFLDSENIEYQLAKSDKPKTTVDIAAEARKYTVLVECWK